MNEETRTIRVNMPTGIMHYVQVYKGETIGDVREMLHLRYGYPLMEMKFELRKQLVGDDTDVSVIDHQTNDYLMCIIPSQKRMVHIPETITKYCRHTKKPLLCDEISRPRPERQQESERQEKPPVKPVRTVCVKRPVPPVHRIVTSKVGSSVKKPPSHTGLSSIDMLLSKPGEH